MTLIFPLIGIYITTHVLYKIIRFEYGYHQIHVVVIYYGFVTPV